MKGATLLPSNIGLKKEALLTFPSVVWLALFFLIPTAVIFAYAFKPADLYGGIGEGWTLVTLAELYNSYIFAIVWRTLWLSAWTTVCCLFLALPVGYQLMTTSARMRNFFLMMIIVPFWSSFLIRIYAWKTVLHPEGILHEVLVWLGAIAPETTLLYNPFAVLLVMVYTFLPFAVLPIYAAASKFNFQLLEAAMDLGASRFQAFARVFIPGIQKGIVTAVVMVFIPAFGTYVIPDLVGGARSEMLGNKIAQKTFVDRNLPEASAMSVLLALAVFVPVAGIMLYTGRARKIEASVRSRE